MFFGLLDGIVHPFVRWNAHKQRLRKSPNVATILANRQRRQAYVDELTPLGSLYRMYEYIILDDNIALRNEIEWFFHRGSSWSVNSIPDPRDPDPERYAIISVLPQYLVYAFNNLIEKGLPRGAPPILSDEALEYLKTTPKLLEAVPKWVEKVPKLEKTLDIPDSDGISADESNRSKWFLAMNINMYEPHVLFV